MNLGLAFQIKDDILDVTGDVEKLGKNTLADVNKSNFITMYGLEECKVMCEDLTAECITILDKISVNTDILKELTIELLKEIFNKGRIFMSKLLDKISSPIDVHKFSNKELTMLSNEIREFLIDNVLKTGGHLSSNLGVVELTLSLYKNFNLEKDKIVWDVGHQSYVHKMLSGRKDKFNTLRKYKGISGFPKISESKYDAFGTGHSSTSISAALGIARARDILKEDYNVVAVIGDGALTGGMALEAINDVGFNKSKMIIILNDNQMSISKNVGALSNHLNMLRVAPNYNKIKNEINETLNTSVVGKSVANSIHKIKIVLKI